MTILRSLLACALLVLACQANAQAQIRIDRLEKIAYYLETQVAPDHFTFSTWGTTDNPDDPDYLGCVAGHATRAFGEKAFYLERCDDSIFPLRVAFNTGGKHLLGFAAVGRFFGVSDEDGRYLFMNTGKDTIAEAVKKIREVIQREKFAQLVASL